MTFRNVDINHFKTGYIVSNLPHDRLDKISYTIDRAKLLTDYNMIKHIYYTTLSIPYTPHNDVLLRYTWDDKYIKFDDNTRSDITVGCYSLMHVYQYTDNKYTGKILSDDDIKNISNNFLVLSDKLDTLANYIKELIDFTRYVDPRKYHDSGMYQLYLSSIFYFFTITYESDLYSDILQVDSISPMQQYMDQLVDYYMNAYRTHIPLGSIRSYKKILKKRRGC